MKCLNCGKEISTGQNFCKYCGASVKIQPATNKQAFKTCKKCGAPINEGNRFCDQCGTPINDVIVIDDGEETGKLKKITKAIIIILCVAALCGLGILAYNLLKNGSMFGAGGNNQNQKENNVASDILPQPAADVTEPDSQETKPAAENKDTEGAEKDQSSGDNSIDPVAVKNTVTIDVNIPYEAVTFENHSYYIFDNGCESWNEAKKYCESRGGYLAVINSPEENEFLYNYMLDIGYDEVFFGYTDQDQEKAGTSDTEERAETKADGQDKGQEWIPELNRDHSSAEIPWEYEEYEINSGALRKKPVNKKDKAAEEETPAVSDAPGKRAEEKAGRTRRDNRLQEQTKSSPDHSVFEDYSFQISSDDEIGLSQESMQKMIAKGMRDLENYDTYLRQETDGQYAMVIQEEPKPETHKE